MNKNGIEVLSGDPRIYENVIEKNYDNGIYTRIIEDLRCEPLIYQNIIEGNRENGVHINGSHNFTRVENGNKISYSRKVGIRVANKAHAYIAKNNIFKNMMQGVLIVETATAFVKGNQISENLKANIALGGDFSNESSIIENTITAGRCEGIFLLECGDALISNNTITTNHDGIVMVESIPKMVDNKILNNKWNGIFVIKDSRPTVVGNVVKDNWGMGVYIRDKSEGEWRSNVLMNNEIDLVIENKHPNLADIVPRNQIFGDIRIPQNFDDCRLI